MFTEELPLVVFQKQREFIKAVGLTKTFIWQADHLITEETKELIEAYEHPVHSDENIAEIFKELADVIYVVVGFYNMLPSHANELVSDEINERLQKIMYEAEQAVSLVTHKLQIPFPLVLAAFELVHASNMTKFDDNGKPIRNAQGKVIKGPNYKAPDLMPLVQTWKNFHKSKQQGTENASNPE